MRIGDGWCNFWELSKRQRLDELSELGGGGSKDLLVELLDHGTEEGTGYRWAVGTHERPLYHENVTAIA